MNRLKIFSTLLIIALMTWGTEIIYFKQKNAATYDNIKAEIHRERNHENAEFPQRISDLEKEYMQKKYIATGKTVYDRIYNTQDQSIIDLITRISEEALPESWSSEVKVEEFTHFILLIYIPHNSLQVSPTRINSYLEPVLEYCGWLLSDIAVFDKTHKSYLFYDKPILDEIKLKGLLPQNLVDRARVLGESFTKFNSITVICERQNNQLYVPIEVSGTNGIVNCYALLDTGASVTTLSNDEVISKTGLDNLQNAPRQSFITANGFMSCPIVYRDINVGGLLKHIEVAVNQRDEMNLLGVNFFDGTEYIIDFQNSAIYVWEK